MDIPAYRKANALSQAKFAELLTAKGSPATQGLVSQWEQGATIPAERCVEIEAATDGEIKRSDLRPDLWPVEAAA
jgi:DNA-binding transcriptional regulator YdaS (Cro superfamily)